VSVAGGVLAVVLVRLKLRVSVCSVPLPLVSCSSLIFVCGDVHAHDAGRSAASATGNQQLNNAADKQKAHKQATKDQDQGTACLLGAFYYK
jgi:hypothetical protein